MDDEDDDLWQAMTKDVKPLRGKKRVKGKDKADITTIKETVMPQMIAKTVTKATGQDLDHRTEERLRSGKMEIEARLDLHGFTQDAAYKALNEFILRCHAQNKRCVLVITGQGKHKEEKEWFEPRRGILKIQVPEWLSAEEMKPYVLKFVPAKRKDGGEGSLYVLLRRQR